MSDLTAAVSAVITDAGGRVLLCQQSQGHRLWSLPGGRIRHRESPVDAVVRDIREETGLEVEPVDLVGIYHLTGGDHLPDVLMYGFRARVDGGEASVNSPGRICRLSWHDPTELPEPLAATCRVAIADAIADRAGVLRLVTRNAEPELADADDESEPALA